jgi:hypothetical protein
MKPSAIWLAIAGALPPMKFAISLAIIEACGLQRSRPSLARAGYGG